MNLSERTQTKLRTILQPSNCLAEHDEATVYECAAMGCESCMNWICDREAEWKVEHR